MHFALHAIFLAFPILLPAVTSEVVKNFQKCSTLSNCDISALRVDPCPEALLPKPKPCVLKRGLNATIAFDFEGKQGVGDLKAGAYSATVIDIPLEGMDKEGCKYTECPTTGATQTYQYVLNMQSYFPAAGYKVKWRLHKDGEMECCLTFRIKVE